MTNDRRTIAYELSAIEQALKDLEIRYEQYFAGVEKREPMAARAGVAKRLQRFANRKIIQTDLRFRYQTLAGRYHSYAGYWDRILRLMDEGRYRRQMPRTEESARKSDPTPEKENVLDRLYRQLLQAHEECSSEKPAPSRRQLAEFLEEQKSRVREKFGDREVEFHVSAEDGKPKLKVRAKR